MRLAVVDSDFIPYTVCYNKKNEDIEVPDKTFEECCELADRFINNIFKATKATHYIMAFTVGKCFRYTVNPEYKANRKKIKEVIPFLRETKEYLIGKYGGIGHSDLEADDICRIINRNAHLEHIRLDGNEPPSFIVSPDKDMLNLQGKHYNPRDNEWVETTQEQEDEYFWTSMIAGDTSDNIKGLPGKGEAFAKKLFEITTGYKPEAVLSAYISHYRDMSTAVDEYYKNFKCLKILTKYDGFSIPKPIEIVNDSF